MTSSTKFDVYRCTLEELGQLMPNAKAHYIDGSTRIKLPNISLLVSIRDLGARLLEIKHSRARWSLASEGMLTDVDKKLQSLDYEGFLQYRQSLPCFLPCCTNYRHYKRITQDITFG